MMITFDDKKTTDNVVFPSFPTIAKEAGNPTNGMANIVSFEKTRQPMKTKPTEFQVESYLDWLVAQRYIDPHQEKKLRAATAPLFQEYPGVDESIKELVQMEFTGDKTPHYNVIADKEEAYWLAALDRGQTPLPAFDYPRARAIFTAPPEERTTRVSFLKPEFATDVPVVDIKRELAKANAFFHIMLRMIRLQYEKDHPASQSLFDSFTDKPVSAEELFARTELKLNDVLREPPPPESSTNLFKEQRAMLANIKAVADQLHHLAEESKRLRPPASPSPSRSERKPTIWRKLLDRLRKK